MDHLCCLCLVFFMLSYLFFAALWSPAGKVLTSWLLFVMFNYIFVTFPCGILDQVCYLIVSIPDRCRLSYFNVSCSRTQRSDAGEARTRNLSLESSTLPLSHCAQILNVLM